MGEEDTFEKRRRKRKTGYVAIPSHLGIRRSPCSSIWGIKVVTFKRDNLLKNGCRKKFKKRKCISENP
jgi:hypothetical protein